MVVYRITDRIPVKIGDATFWLAPLSSEQKSRIFALAITKSGTSIENAFKGAVLTMQFSLKKLEGVMTATGEPYELEFGEDGMLTEQCAEELCSLGAGAQIIKLAIKWAQDTIKSPAECDMTGVEVDFAKVESVKKKV